MAAPAAGTRPDGTNRIVVPSKFNEVAMWSWDVQVDNCAICKNHISDICLECQENQIGTNNCECQVAWGVCNHAFHHHCISKWLKTRSVCPLCDREWETNNLTSNS